MTEVALLTIAVLSGFLAGWSVHRSTGAIVWPGRVAAVVLAAVVATAAAYAVSLAILLFAFGFGP